MDKVIFETERLIVREWTLDDVEAVFEIYRNPNVHRFLSGGPGHVDHEESRATLERWIARYAQFPGYGFWAIVERSTGSIIGSAAVKPLSDGPEIEVGYHLAEPAWGKGYATEIAIGGVEYGFNVMGLDRIVGVCNPQNQASFRVLQKAGLKSEGLRFHYGGEAEYLAITRAEFEASGTDTE